MVITDVRIKLANEQSGNLLAFAAILIDPGFLVRDLKLIRGAQGLFVAMPSKKLTDHCPRCQRKNALDVRYCGKCCRLLGEDRGPRDDQGRRKIHVDVVHPINDAVRELFETAILQAYELELARAREANYTCNYDAFVEEQNPQGALALISA
jgi:stage V sporulation protein G